MILGKKILAIITARGGSKGLPKKNIRKLGDKPLIAWTIEAALASSCIDRLILSSDDETIIRIAKDWGCEAPFIRENHLAMDETSTPDVVLDAMLRCPGYDWVVVLQPTSPLRTTADIDDCLYESISQGASVGVSVSESFSSPYWMFNRDDLGQLQPLLPIDKVYTRRQDLPKVYQLNGAVYVAECCWLLEHATFITPNTYAYVMPKQRSIDIDDLLDFNQAEYLLSERSLAEQDQQKSNE